MKNIHNYTAAALASALCLTGCATTDPSAQRKPSDQQVADTLPRNRIWYPGDPMPTNVIGLRLAGDFAFTGTNTEGNPKLVPVQDVRNPLARQYWLVNVYDRIGRGVYIPHNQRTLVRVSPKRPLVIIGRGILPGIYNVAYQ